jgi:hypothetical protein
MVIRGILSTELMSMQITDDIKSSLNLSIQQLFDS